VHHCSTQSDTLVSAVRTFSRLGQSRHLSKNYDHLSKTRETFIYLTMSRTMLQYAPNRVSFGPYITPFRRFLLPKSD